MTWKISTRSVVEGAEFVITEHMNQDCLERHFSHLRQKGGGSENPTVWEALHILNELRAVRAESWVPVQGANCDNQLRSSWTS